ncbi:MAG: hypothetical protein SCALA702_15910 [Melioribacteraceae bacterium]|nr:MAG: hypothetical protein SCALA702_15910 [Melioribacteraceae bacterium]
MKQVNSILLLLLAFATVNFAGDDQIAAKIAEIKSAHEKAYYNFSKEEYMKIWADCERVISIAPDNGEAKYFASLTAFRLMNVGLVKGDKSVVEKYADAGIKYADDIESDATLAAESAIVKANILMMKLAIVPQEAAALSGQIHGLIGKAEAMDPGNPRAILTKGIMLYNTPEQYGGSVQKAAELFTSAMESFDENSQKLIDWGHNESMAWLGQAYARMGKIGKARGIYNEALKYYPDFGWVRYQLLPALDQK